MSIAIICMVKAENYTESLRNTSRVNTCTRGLTANNYIQVSFIPALNGAQGDACGSKDSLWVRCVKKRNSYITPHTKFLSISILSS